MIRRVLASLLCVLGAAALGLGIASATLWRPSDTLVAQARAGAGTTMIVTDPGVLDLAADDVTVRAEAPSTVVIALGRSGDVDAWVGEDPHTRVTGLAGWHRLAAVRVGELPEETSAADVPEQTASDPPAEPLQTTPTDPAQAPESPAAAPDPAASDLWVDEVSGDGEATLTWSRQDGRWSVLVAATGEDAAGPSVTLEWPQVVTTPWLMPGVVAGSLLLLVGMGWWALILVAGRRPRAAQVAVEPEAAPAVPLTRRQIRELEARHGRVQDRESVAERFPKLVPASRPQEEHRGRHGAETADDTPDDAPTVVRRVDRAHGRHGIETAAQTLDEAATAHTPDEAAGTPVRAVADVPAPAPADAAPGAATAEATGAASGGRRARRAERGRRFGRRRKADPVAAPAEPAAPSNDAASEVQADERPGTPVASADAWRRTWGLAPEHASDTAEARTAPWIPIREDGEDR